MLESGRKATQEIEKHKQENVRLHKENEAMQRNLKEWISTASANANLITGLEHTIRLLTSEKRDYELLLTKYSRK